ncbi:MAG: ribosome small subunit-dependent GTPase A [Clostridiaceae bacterium]|nr:ribosome small subunit-dependent GTPase A [Clostridiaceae bacterium]
MEGKIIRGVAGFYYVHVEGQGILECRAKGIFRNQKIKPLVGDNVRVELLDGEKQLGNLTEIFKRDNCLIRPAVANVDQAVVIFAASYPKPNLNLLDRFLLTMEMQKLPVYICFNKSDEGSREELEDLQRQYDAAGYPVCVTSTISGEGMEQLYVLLEGKTTVFAGPSGVGKSSVMNILFPEAQMEIGEISEKIKRGKHTTRHSELFYLGEKTYAMDTPGFTSLELPEMEKEALKEFYPEFALRQQGCRFQGCVHIHEPECAVKQAVEAGEISKRRYETYRQFYRELAGRKKY